MIQNTGLRGRLYQSLGAAWVVSAVSTAAIGASLKADLSAFPEPALKLVGGAFENAQRSAWWTVPILVGVTTLLTWMRKMMGPPWVWTAINEHMDLYRNELFGAENDRIHDHRVTLFRCAKWHQRIGINHLLFKFGPLLVPVARSGHQAQKSTSFFRVSEKGKGTQGVAGETWSRQRVWCVMNLPQPNSVSDDSTITDYAEKTTVDKKWVIDRLRSGAGLPMSICGIPVRVGGKPWGVLVIDSVASDPDGISEDNENSYNLFSQILSPLLKKV